MCMYVSLQMNLVSLHVSLVFYVPSCSECPAGTYSDSVSNSPCQSCPDNSEANQTGLSECPCVQNYYRAPDEGAGEACTRELGLHTHVVGCASEGLTVQVHIPVHVAVHLTLGVWSDCHQ